MKKILIICFLFCGTLSAQEAKISLPSQISLKVQGRLNYTFHQGKTFQLTGISPALIYKTKKKRIHQFELSGLNMENTSDLELNQTHLTLTTSYEYSIPLEFFKNKGAINPYVGMGVSIGALSNQVRPVSSLEFKQSYSSYLADFYIIPQVQRDLGKGFFADLALLIYLGELGISHLVNENPSLPLRNQYSTIFEADFYKGQKYTFRFGFGIRL